MTEPSNLYHDGLELMVWGMICCDGAVEMVEVTGRMNSEDYIAILKSNVIKKRVFKNGSIF